MTARTLFLAAAVTAITSIPASAQEPAPSPQPGTAPRTRGATPAAEQPRTIAPPTGQPRTIPTPTEQPRITPPAAAPAAAVPERPRREGQPVNIKIELELTDQRAGAALIKRTVTLIAADGYTGSIRTQASIYRMSEVPLNVDASPTLLSDGKIRLAINLQYDWPAPIESGKEIPVGSVTRTTLHDSLWLILENGKPIIAAQSADPVGDRQVTVDVKATVLK
jgi:hypothetical protein